MVRPKQKLNSTFAVLDLGTSKLAAIIAETSKTGELNIIGYAVQESSGLRGGEINNLEVVYFALVNIFHGFQYTETIETSLILIFAIARTSFIAL